MLLSRMQIQKDRYFLIHVMIYQIQKDRYYLNICYDLLDTSRWILQYYLFVTYFLFYALLQIEADASSAQEKSSESIIRIRDLRERIAALKVKFTENEVKVQQATGAADSASDLANEAEKVTCYFEQLSYNVINLVIYCSHSMWNLIMKFTFQL